MKPLGSEKEILEELVKDMRRRVSGWENYWGWRGFGQVVKVWEEETVIFKYIPPEPQWSKLGFFLASPNTYMYIFNHLPEFFNSPTYVGNGLN